MSKRLIIKNIENESILSGKLIRFIFQTKLSIFLDESKNLFFFSFSLLALHTSLFVFFHFVFRKDKTF